MENSQSIEVEIKKIFEDIENVKSTVNLFELLVNKKINVKTV